VVAKVLNMLLRCSGRLPGCFYLLANFVLPCSWWLPVYCYVVVKMF